jgi:hypothetical protein
MTRAPDRSRGTRVEGSGSWQDVPAKLLVPDCFWDQAVEVGMTSVVEPAELDAFGNTWPLTGPDVLSAVMVWFGFFRLCQALDSLPTGLETDGHIAVGLVSGTRWHCTVGTELGACFGHEPPIGSGR